ncbi:MAG: hypothetical protein KME30_25105 [Iphinoe sp. HA4291-MV1]|jgi:hypothetical protein|nr:hypothetical protein [Iphinoe sp. HA4291-MV1]
MAEVLTQPQFQVVTHKRTGAKTGRIYFPAAFVAEYHLTVKQWLLTQDIQFELRDLKLYADGSFRIYFLSNSPKKQYLHLIQSLPKTAFV